jgi:hypothetical protein
MVAYQLQYESDPILIIYHNRTLDYMELKGSMMLGKTTRQKIEAELLQRWVLNDEQKQSTFLEPVLHHRRIFYTIVGDAPLIPRCSLLRFDHGPTTLMHYFPYQDLHNQRAARKQQAVSRMFFQTDER